MFRVVSITFHVLLVRSGRLPVPKSSAGVGCTPRGSGRRSICESPYSTWLRYRVSIQVYVRPVYSPSSTYSGSEYRRRSRRQSVSEPRHVMA